MKSLSVCNKMCFVSFNTGHLHEVQSSAEMVRDSAHTLPLSSVCTVALPDSIKDMKTYTPKSNPWGLSEEILQILPRFAQQINSYIFTRFFFDAAKRSDLSSVEFWRAFHVVWNEANREWQSLCIQMIDGSISLAETESVFSMFRAEGGSYRYDDIRLELPKLDTSGSDQWVSDRIQQFSCFTDIKKYVKAAAMLLKVKSAYNIEGDFGDIEKVYSLVSIVFKLFMFAYSPFPVVYYYYYYYFDFS